MKRSVLMIWLSLFLCLVLTAGCAARESDDDAQGADELEVLYGSLEPDPTPTPMPLEAIYFDYSGYRGVLLDTQARYEETMGGDYLLYALCDLNGDGVLELLVQEGTCEADMIWHVFTVGEMGAQSVGSFGGSHSELFIDDEAGILCQYGHMGHERIDRITYDGEYLSYTTLIEQDLEPGAEYSEPGTPAATALITDSSLIP